MKNYNWKKKGLIYEPSICEFTHGSHPCIIRIKDDNHLVAFTRRDKNNKSHIFLSNAIVHDNNVELIGEPKLALKPGSIGYFDCDGVISVGFIRHNGICYLYYTGWQNLPDGLWIMDTGRVVVDVDNLTLRREFAGPVLGRDKYNPLFAAATAFLIIDDVWHTWYNAGIRWEKAKDGFKHYYGIHHAQSSNGVDWVCEPNMSIPFADDYEYAFGRPCVVVMDGMYCMWYAHRATKDIDKYRIGFAISHDAHKWERHDKSVGIDVSNEGWDSEMICYPYVFDHKGKWYMLYNGNDFGRTGFGLAILENE